MKPPKNHTHRPLVWVTVCFGIGILLDTRVSIPLFALYGLTVVFVAAGFLSVNRQRIFLICILISFMLLGAAHSQAHKILPLDHISHMARFYYGVPVLLEGVVVSDVEQRHRLNASPGELTGRKTIFRLEVDRLKARGVWRKSRGEVLVNLFRAQDIACGDYLAVEGKLHKPFNFSTDNRFSYRDYLDRRGIKFILSVKKQGRVEVLADRLLPSGSLWLRGGSLWPAGGKNRGNPVYRHVIRLKNRFNAILEDHFAGAQKGIMQGFLLGDRYNIPEHINELFQLAGVVHILAISGFNVGIVAYATFLFLKILPIGRRWHYILTIFILIAYAVLTGGQPPVVRATIMAVVFLASFILEREPESINTLACAALLILCVNPSNLFDVGFQLSFVSVLAIIVLYPKFMGILSPERGGAETSQSDHKAVLTGRFFLKYTTQSFMLSLAAYSGVAVMVAYYFELVTPVAILANLVVIPLASLIVVLGIGLLLTGLALPIVTFLFADCIRVLLALMVKAVFLCVQIPGAYFRTPGFPVWLVLMYYLIISCFLWLPRRKTSADRHLAEKATIFS